MLSTLIWLPIVGAIVLGFFTVIPEARLKLTALIISGAIFVWSLSLTLHYDINSSAFQLQEYLPWLENLGLNYQLGLDGLSLPLIILNGFLTWIAIFSSPETIERPRLFYALVLLVSGAVSGAFLAQNLLLFFLFYEIELVPFYLLVSIWGGGESELCSGQVLALYCIVWRFNSCWISWPSLAN